MSKYELEAGTKVVDEGATTGTVTDVYFDECVIQWDGGGSQEFRIDELRSRGITLITPCGIVQSILDGDKIPLLGCWGTVAANIANRNVENALTYLLGVQDAFGSIPNREMCELVRSCRSELKKHFRKES